jgi:hypothetical protein
MSAAAWENVGGIPLLIATPNTDLVTMEWAIKYAGMWKPEGTYLQGWSGMPIDVARNVFVKNAREVKARYLLYMDSDVIPVRNDWIRQLLDTQEPIISGLYWSKKGYPGIWLKNKEDPPGKQTYSPVTAGFRGGSIIEVDAIGAGALLIDMRVFDEIDKVLGPQPYFVWQWPDPTDIQPGQKSEDFYFCDLAQRAGFSILCHTGIELNHEQTVTWDNRGVPKARG